MTASRPFEDVPALLRIAEARWWKLGDADFREAFAAHPRIGDKKGGAWSAQEQSGAAAAARDTLGRLQAQNDAYFDRHGFIFIVCATGKAADEMLALLDARLPKDTAEEVRTAAEEQANITRLRLRKWLKENA